MARKWLKGRCVFLHTDGARSYKLGINRKRKLEGVIHDYVIHKKKVNGKWVRPKYVELFGHVLPDGTTVCTKGGSQIIDRVWHHIREHVMKRSITISRKLWYNRVRSAQWLYWNSGEDSWAETGNMFMELS